MPTWSDLYYLRKHRVHYDLPPLEKGIKVFVHFVPKFPKNEFDGGIEMYVKVLDIIGEYVVARTEQKIDHIRRKEILTFHRSHIYQVTGDWDYSRKYQYVKVSKGVFYKKNPIDVIYHLMDEPPLSYGMIVKSKQDEIHSPFDDDEYIKLSIDKVIELYPETEPCLRDKWGHFEKIGGVFLELDTFERKDDEDEWQYHNR